MRYLRHGAVVLTLMLALVAVRYALDAGERQDVIRLAATDLRLAGERLAADSLASRAQCHVARAEDDFDTLADAVIAVESIGTDPLQRWLEEMLVRGAALSGFPAWDLSVGPAQIRISTAVAAGGWAAVGEHWVESDRNQIALDLLSDCGARKWGKHVLLMLASQRQARQTALERDAIMRLAAEFNGQETVPDHEAAIAHYIYRELVYHVFQELRFRRQTGAVARVR